MWDVRSLTYTQPGSNPSKKYQEPYPDGLGQMGWVTHSDLPIKNTDIGCMLFKLEARAVEGYMSWPGDVRHTYLWLIYYICL